MLAGITGSDKGINSQKALNAPGNGKSIPFLPFPFFICVWPHSQIFFNFIGNNE
jgi:hypothetical protein